jgi:Na+-driven multidrug efflux pump
MSLIRDLLYRPPNLPTASKYAVINGVIYLAAGVLLIAWPGATQTLLRDADFVGKEQGLIRVIGLSVVVIGWLYLFGGYTGGRQVVAASVIDRLIFVPIVLLPLAFTGVFPHLLVAFTILDMTLAIGAWLSLSRAGENIT